MVLYYFQTCWFKSSPTLQPRTNPWTFEPNNNNEETVSESTNRCMFSNCMQAFPTTHLHLHHVGRRVHFRGFHALPCSRRCVPVREEKKRSNFTQSDRLIRHAYPWPATFYRLRCMAFDGLYLLVGRRREGEVEWSFTRNLQANPFLHQREI